MYLDGQVVPRSTEGSDYQDILWPKKSLFMRVGWQKKSFKIEKYKKTTKLHHENRQKAIRCNKSSFDYVTESSIDHSKPKMQLLYYLK